MRYLMLVCVDPSAEPFDPAQDNVEEWVALNDKSGRRILGNRLEHVSKAKTVRVRKGQLLVTDGPFAETREWIGGFDLLDCANIEEAIEIASTHPMARFGRIEVRALSKPATAATASRSTPCALGTAGTPMSAFDAS